MKREFDISLISILEKSHQKAIYDMYNSLINIKDINDYPLELAREYLEKLDQISNHYNS